MLVHLHTFFDVIYLLQIKKSFVEQSLERVIRVLDNLSGGNQISGECENPPSDPQSTNNFYSELLSDIQSWTGVRWMQEKKQILPELNLNAELVNKTTTTPIGTWSTSKELDLSPSFKNTPIRRFFRVGTVKVSREDCCIYYNKAVTYYLIYTYFYINLIYSRQDHGLVKTKWQNTLAIALS